MWYQTALTKLLGITYPIIQAPMAGEPPPNRVDRSLCRCGRGRDRRWEPANRRLNWWPILWRRQRIL